MDRDLALGWVDDSVLEPTSLDSRLLTTRCGRARARKSASRQGMATMDASPITNGASHAFQDVSDEAHLDGPEGEAGTVGGFARPSKERAENEDVSTPPGAESARLNTPLTFFYSNNSTLR